MAFSVASMAKNFHDYGVSRSTYDNESQMTLNTLIQLRSEPVIDLEREAELIHSLSLLEIKKSADTRVAAIDLGRKTVKMYAGPVGDFATDVIASTAKKQVQGSDQDLASDVAGSLMETAKKEATHTVYKKTAEYALDWFGMAAASFVVMAAPAVVGFGVAAAATTCLFVPSARETCMNFVSNTAKGAQGMYSEARGQVFENDNKNQRIIDSYYAYDKKRVKLVEKIQLHADAKILFDELAAALEAKVNDLSEIKQQSDLRKAKKLGRLVIHLKKEKAPHRFLTRLFSALSSRFKAEKLLLKTLSAQKKQLKVDIQEQQEKVDNQKLVVDRVAQKILRKELIVADLENHYVDYLNDREEAGLASPQCS